MRLKQREIWKVHPIYTDYEISNFGQVRSSVNRKNTWVGRVLKSFSNFGYLNVILSKNRKTKYKKVHRLVLETFIGPCPEGKECNHKDGNKTNNCISNLEWVTRSENEKHAYKNKLQIPIKGEKHKRSKLKNSEVQLIKKLLVNKVTQEKIAKIFKVCQVTIFKIKSGKTWNHLNGVENEA